jgi:hypothetical protein
MTALWVILFSTLTMWIIVYFAIRASIPEQGFRRTLFVIAALLPFVLVIALVRTMFKKVEPRPCPQALREAEKEVDDERVATFGGTAMQPSLTEAWHASYLRSLERTAEGIDRLLHHHRPLFHHL